VRLDAHQHFWDLRRCRYDWLRPDHGVLYEDHGPADLAPLLAERGIAGTLAVQASDTVAETRHLLAIAQAHSFVRGVVGWVPLERPEAASTIAELARDARLVGLRPMLQDLAQDDWILRSDVAVGLDALESAGLVFDALVRPHQLEHVVALARRRPRLSIVLDHAAKPALARGAAWEGADAWRRHVAALAACPNTTVKLSGLVTEARPDWTVQDLAPTVQFLLERFGPRRVLWGSDWPVVRLAGGYARWWDATLALLSHLTTAEREDVLGTNAERVYLAPRTLHDSAHTSAAPTSRGLR
jgi:L-fuconolactonase